MEKSHPSSPVEICYHWCSVWFSFSFFEFITLIPPLSSPVLSQPSPRRHANSQPLFQQILLRVPIVAQHAFVCHSLIASIPYTVHLYNTNALPDTPRTGSVSWSRSPCCYDDESYTLYIRAQDNHAKTIPDMRYYQYIMYLSSLSTVRYHRPIKSDLRSVSSTLDIPIEILSIILYTPNEVLTNITFFVMMPTRQRHKED